MCEHFDKPGEGFVVLLCYDSSGFGLLKKSFHLQFKDFFFQPKDQPRKSLKQRLYCMTEFSVLGFLSVQGSKCQFRHCEKTIGSDTVCSLWREGKCSHQLCKFRHMEIQQKYNSISCFWETQPLGCIRISCVFHHRKPRNINGLFLPPSFDSTLQKDVQEGILHPVKNQDSTKSQESTLRPIHPPLIITINLEEEEEEEQEDEYAYYLLSKTPEDIEEEKTIKEICYKSGEYYRIKTSQENHLTKNSPSVLKNDFLKPMETGRDLQEGDSVAVPSKFNTERKTEITSSLDSSARSDLNAFENGGGDCYLPQRSMLVGGIQNKIFSGDKGFPSLRCSNSKATGHTESIKKHHFKGVKKKKWISEEAKNLSIPLTGKESQWEKHFLEFFSGWKVSKPELW
ncbi:hypothetical protein JRQ81_016061 [Phrynocephalus forsythii]|uniref:Zinc-finger CCCH domain-containing protein n=1 Tax=Phrynocephalus forsythii TaxID=171643 RepID=A0A9Q0XV62_9SAUR|nr:hypothetical protein JRQ81_016061 [Phrynocephalus forsythii]